jgi:acyl-CoA synthetase (AMP-forming)/AMP-acid ligase II
MKSLIECLEHWALVQPDQAYCTFLDGAGRPREQYTYRTLLERSRRLAEHLAADVGVRNRERVLLAYTPGLECIAAFFACVLLGAVPVPVAPPLERVSRYAVGRLSTIARNCRSRIALSTNRCINELSLSEVPQQRGSKPSDGATSLTWIATDQIDG